MVRDSRQDDLLIVKANSVPEGMTLLHQACRATPMPGFPRACLEDDQGLAAPRPARSIFSQKLFCVKKINSIKKDDPVKNRWQPTLPTVNQQDKHCTDGRTLLFEVCAICEAIKKISDYQPNSASLNAEIVGERLCGTIVPFLCLPKEKEPKERAPHQHWPGGPQF